MSKKIMTRGSDRIIGGVCSSLSDKYNFHKWLLRLIFVVTTAVFTFPVLLYLILWIIIPDTKVNNNTTRKKRNTYYR